MDKGIFRGSIWIGSPSSSRSCWSRAVFLIGKQHTILLDNKT
jgi:hypothetical protein